MLPVLVVGLNEPQEFKGIHDQITPELVESFATTAVSVAMAPISSEFGGAGLNETEITGEVILIVAVADCVTSLIDVAVMVTDPPLGTAAGAV